MTDDAIAWMFIFGFFLVVAGLVQAFMAYDRYTYRKRCAVYDENMRRRAEALRATKRK